MGFRSSAAVSVCFFILLASCVPVSPREASDTYRTWVLDQADAFAAAVAEFTAAIQAGNREKAQALYAPSRVFFLRIDPVGPAGDLSARIIGEYRNLEKLLWSTDDLKAGAPAAGSLAADSKILRTRLENAVITVSLMRAGAGKLLEQARERILSRQEELHSRTDLMDFEANLEGAEQIWRILSPSVRTTDPELAKTIDARFSLVYGLLEVQKKYGVFRPFSDVYPKEIQALTAAAESLAGAMGRLP